MCLIMCSKHRSIDKVLHFVIVEHCIVTMRLMRIFLEPAIERISQ